MTPANVTEALRSSTRVDTAAADEPPRPILLMLPGAAISLFHLYYNTFGVLSDITFAALHMGFFGFLCALMYPVAPTARGLPRALDRTASVVLALLVLASGVYVVLMENALYRRGIRFIWSDWLMAIVGIVVVLELTRRTMGPIIPILVILALTYAGWWGRLVEGVFNFPGLSWQTLLFRAYFGPEGMLGPIARISMTFVFMFILFGAFLLRSGAGQFIIDLARCATGRLVGGPGLVAVSSSCLMGSISGSAVANTAATGVITIPLMKRAGYPASLAAGIEAAASTGGGLMPPIMGAGAFVMATLTQISYLTIAAVALLPALLYYLSLAFWVRIEAKKHGFRPVDEDSPRLLAVIRRGGHSVVPLIVLIVLLIAGFSPTYAAGISIVSVVVVSWLTPKRMGLRAVIEALDLGARNMVATAMMLICIGLVVNVIGLTAIGNVFSLLIEDWAGGSLFVMIVLVGLASLILGMGLPVTASYVVLAALSAPALNGLIVEHQAIQALVAGAAPEMLGMIVSMSAPELADKLASGLSVAEARQVWDSIPRDILPTITEQLLSPVAVTTALLSAHMIIYWVSLDSNVTPPVCITAFTAAAIAKASPMATGLAALRVAKGLYIIPMLFAFTPFLSGDVWAALQIFFFGAFGLYALIGFLSGHLETRVPLWLRPFLAALGVLLLWPVDLVYHLAGAIAVAALVVILKLQYGRRAAAPA